MYYYEMEYESFIIFSVKNWELPSTQKHVIRFGLIINMERRSDGRSTVGLWLNRDWRTVKLFEYII